MSGTVRIPRTEASPSTYFYLSADLYSTNAEENESVVRCYIGAINKGNSSSQYGGAGLQSGSIDGVGTFRTRSGDPFLSSGYAYNQLRWEDGPYYVTVPHNANGSKTATLRMVLDYGSIARNLTANLVLPKLTVVPGIPTGVAGARVSDAEVTVSWAQTSASNGQPVTNTVQRRVNGGAWVDVVEVLATTSVGVAAAANQKIEYRVSASNAAGDSAWSVVSAPVFTTPGAPTGLAATKDAALDIVVSWTPHVPFTEHQHVVEHGVVAAGVTTWDGSPLASVDAGTSSFKHVDPDPADVHVYRVSARNTDTGALQSATVLSNQVQLLVAPNKPTLAPLPAYADKASEFVFPWTHNSIDTTAQTAYEVGYSTDGGDTWSTTGKVASTTSLKTFAASTYTANQQLTLRVRTWGQAATGGTDGTGVSPWSDQATVTFKTRPTATIVSPEDAGVYTAGVLEVGLGFAQSEGAAFVNATIKLYEAGVLLETRGSTTLASTTLATRVDNGGEYTVTATVRDSNGLVSDEATSNFSVAYTLPVAAILVASYLASSGIAQLGLTIAEPGVGEVEAVTVTITRSIAGVSETVVEKYPTAESMTFLDRTPTINGTNVYTVTTFSADGATAETVETLVTAEGKWAFLSAGAGFDRIVKFSSNLRLNATPNRDTALLAAAGRREPIALFGENTSLEVDGTATIFAYRGSSVEEIEEFLLEAGRVCYRDPSGRRMFGLVKGAFSDRGPLAAGFSYTVVEAS